MSDKKELIKEVILNNPSLSGNKIYDITKRKGIGIRKTDFYSLFREIKDLPEPTIQKREASVPIRYRIKPIKVKVKPKKIPYEKTKFGKIAKDVQKKHNISERNAIDHTRKLLKIAKKDYRKLRKIDYDILIHYGY